MSIGVVIMPKNIDLYNRLYVRIDSKTKEKAQGKAQSLGLDLSSYIRLLITQDIKKDSN
jgi:antitoxin component of RelBE/YafQ-DinJ toxin-antitoxin module